MITGPDDKLTVQPRKTKISRRTAMATLAGAAAVSVDQASAHHHHYATHLILGGAATSYDLLALFRQAVDAFNGMSTTPKDVSPLKTLLADRVMILDVYDDSGWFNGTRDAAIDALYKLSGAYFDPYHDQNFGSITPTVRGNKVIGQANWTDFDKPGIDLIPRYTFTYKDGLIARMRARAE